jgi:hypothetical protein
MVRGGGLRELGEEGGVEVDRLDGGVQRAGEEEAGAAGAAAEVEDAGSGRQRAEATQGRERGFVVTGGLAGEAGVQVEEGAEAHARTIA